MTARTTIHGLRRSCNRVIFGVLHKQCRACRRWFPRTAEHFKPKRTAFESRCRPCWNEYMRDYQRARYCPIKRRNKPRPSSSAARLLQAIWR